MKREEDGKKDFSSRRRNTREENLFLPFPLEPNQATRLRNNKSTNAESLILFPKYYLWPNIFLATSLFTDRSWAFATTDYTQIVNGLLSGPIAELTSSWIDLFASMYEFESLFDDNWLGDCANFPLFANTRREKSSKKALKIEKFIIFR